MALTRQFLSALQIPESAVQAIIDEHMATVTGIKTDWEARLAKVQADADKLPALEKDLKDAASGKTYKELYEAEHTAHEALKADIAGKAAKTAKENAVKQYYAGKGIPEASTGLALRATSLDALELDDKGQIKDTKPLEDLLSGDLKPLVPTTDGKSQPRVVDSGARLGGDGKPAQSYSIRSSVADHYRK